MATPTPTAHPTAAFSNRGCPLPATPPPTQATPATGYGIFAHELGVRLRTMTSFTTPQSIHTAITKRWNAMSIQDRQHYNAKAATLQHLSSTSVPSLAVLFNPHRDPLPSTPKPSPCGPARSSQSTHVHGSPNVVGQHVAPRNGWRAAGRPASTPTPRHGAAATAAAAAATFHSPSPSRGFAPVSATRLNSVRGPRGHPKIKTEAVPRAAAPAGARRVAVEVIDLTGED